MKYVFCLFWLVLASVAAYYYTTLHHWTFLVLVAMFVVNAHCETHKHEKVK
jgi:hypothetical protein